MDIVKEEKKTENGGDAVINEVKDVKPAAEAEMKTEEAEKPEEPTAELLEKIKNQVEFYFGNVNMQRDKFLIEQTKLDDGWIPMTIMLNFKLLASMSSDVDVILKALEKSDLIEISEDRKRIRRTPKDPLPVYNEEYRKAQEARTAYVKGFPLTGTTIEKLKTFFAAFEPCENIIMRKYQDKDKQLQFKGSIFVQFKTLDDAKAFMARESVKYEDTELIRKWSEEYAQGKEKEKEERKQKRLEGKTKKTENVKEKDKPDSDDEENEKEFVLPKGSVIFISGVANTCTRENIKQKFSELDASIAFIDFKKGDTEGWIRLHGENAAKTVLEKMEDGKVSILGKKVPCRILEGEEEEKYLVKAKEGMTVTRQRSFKNKRMNKKGRVFRQKKRRNSDQDGVPAKKRNDAALD